MAESRQDIENLMEKMGQIHTEPELDDNEKRLLMDILAAAAENTDTEGKELRAQFNRSYVRDDEDEGHIHVTADFKIGVWPKR